jgi:hypothetical protein
MRNGRIICSTLFIVLLLQVVSCSKPEDSNRGAVTISSKFNFDNALVFGYNFELAKSTSFPSTGEPLPDIIVDQYRLIDGSVKPGFSSPDNPDGFWKAGEFGTLTESMDFFENELQTVDPTVGFTPLTDTVRTYQVYVLKTTSGNFAKIHVTGIMEIEAAAGKHIDVKIDYHYQPDGSTGFTD